ncbi:hypothetical protein [Vibrio ziniensis]|uniref:Uncharacterized protein n=1 Tax=Vibrio ziniensis TaxID=2711221 RepID=A0A6G7CP83_9VIBR|nr:hypothetical protein [Vibrio ziniensis]QIH43863.1 hypothetical protein G5S32_17945 [Vibrio ziniensis]
MKLETANFILDKMQETRSIYDEILRVTRDNENDKDQKKVTDRIATVVISSFNELCLPIYEEYPELKMKKLTKE